MWYIAHVIMYMEFLENSETYIPVHEDMYLIEATNSNEAWDKANEIGLSSEILDRDDPVFFGGKPVLIRYGGVRKLIECLPNDEQPIDQTEVTYNKYMRIRS